MLAKQLTSTIIALLAAAVQAGAQGNTLSVPDVSVAQGRSIDLPVNLDNAEDVVAVQFTLYTPEGISIDPATAKLTERADGHTVAMRQTGANRYLAMVFSPENKPVVGRTGKLLSVRMSAAEDLRGEAGLKFVLEDVTIAAADGSNIATGFSAGSIAVTASADLTVQAVAPAARSAAPGGRLAVSWQVANVGQEPATAGWSEQLFLQTAAGESKLIGTAYSGDPLAAGATVSRSAEVELPLQLGIDGEAGVRVRLVPAADTGEPEWMRGNNEAASEATVAVAKLLTLTPDSAQAEEAAEGTVAFRLVRSGSTRDAETFAVQAPADSRIKLPATVTIPARQSGAYFNASVAANGTVDKSQGVAVRVSGNGYPEAVATIVVEDDAQPALTLAADAQDVAEGGTLALTVTAPAPVADDTEVLISCDFPSRFDIPQHVAIPAGQSSSAAILVKALDDDLPDVEQVVTFTATAAKYAPASMLTTLVDNDVPALELQLGPTAVSEADGPLAVTATLRRTSNVDKQVKVMFSDDSGGALYYSSRSVVLPAGVSEATVALGPIDNADADGERTYDISAGVYIASCNCTNPGSTSGGVVSAQLTVHDDDGPALSLRSGSSVLPEGGSVDIAISRNTDSASPLAVGISSDHEAGLSHPSTVTIPANERSATFTVASTGNTVAGDSFVAMLTASADGHSASSLWLNVSDQTLPDARLSSLTAEPSEVVAGDSIAVEFTLHNTGSYALPEQTKIGIYAGDAATTAATAYLQSPLEPGDSARMARLVAMPAAIGTYSVYAVANADRSVKEAFYTNNTSNVATVATSSPFTATASTDKAVYAKGEAVAITGRIAGKGAGGQAVEVYIVNNGYRHTISTTAAADGTFSATYKPFASQLGRFAVGACYPGEGKADAQCTFDIFGMRLATSGYLTAEALVGTPLSGTIHIDNPGVQPLTGIRATATGVPAGCDLQLTCDPAIDGGGRLRLGYTITGSEPTAGNDWQQIAITVEAAECPPLTTTLYYYCRNPRGRLQADITAISTTMTKGRTRDYPVTITNTGGGQTGTISLALPSGGWMTAATPVEMPSLAPGESATIHLRLTPSEAQQLNVPITGRIGINCANGDGLPIQYTVTPVSEAEGTLVVDVCDEWTYNTAEGPHVAEAEVVVKNVNNGAVIASGKTAADGLYSVTLPEGYYTLSVTANRHSSFTGNILVDPGVETRRVVDLSYQAIEIGYELVETEIPDEYVIENIVTFETNVPKPVVVIDGPDRIDGDAMAAGESTLVYFTVTNHGLIRSDNVRFTVPEASGEWLFKALDYTEPFPLGPNQSVLIPVLITHYPNTAQQAKAAIRRAPADVMGACVEHMTATYEVICGTKLYENESAHRMAMKACATIAIANAIGSGLSNALGGGWGSGTSSSGSGPAAPGSTTNKVNSTESKEVAEITNANTLCDPAFAEMMESVLNKLLEKIPIINKINEGADIAYDCARNKKDPGEELLKKIVDDALSESGNNIPKDWKDWLDKLSPLPDDANTLIKDIGELTEAYYKFQNSKEKATQSRAPMIGERAGNYSWVDAFMADAIEFRDELQSYMGILHEVFGDEVWYLDASLSKLQFWQAALADGVKLPLDADALMAHKPESVTEAQLRSLVERLNGTSEANAPDKDALLAHADRISAIEAEAISDGYGSMQDKFYSSYDDFIGRSTEESSSVCSSITLRFEQRMAFTRQAFRGTLTVYNGNTEAPMTDVRLTLRVNDTDGNMATAHEMQVSLESLEGFAGEAQLGAGWQLAPDANGKATILYIPTKYAAPTEPKDYVFSGSLAYVDPYNGMEVTREIYPVTLTVNPSPTLNLTYFVERDVFGDDPLTEAVEPSEDAEFALLVDNVGHGRATNVRLLTKQPEIIDNEKGLLIDFQIVSSSLNGGQKTLALGGTVATEFGDIEAHGQAYAQWWMRSSLLGHFTSYDVSATHLTSYGNPDLSLLGDVSVHELIRSLQVGEAGDSIVGFMANDIADADDAPDIIYLSDGTTQPVAIAAGASVARTSDTTYELTVTPSATGWNYGSLPDPTYGQAALLSVVRKPDGQAMSLRNFWQTDRTLRDGKDPLYENRLHFADSHAGTAPTTYVLTFEPTPRVRLGVASIEGVPEEVAFEPVDSLDVMFNKHIDPATFTADDLSLSVQGESIDPSPIGISTDDGKTFRLDLSRLNETTGNGYYMLTVQTSGITDSEGFSGSTGKSAGWTMFRDGLVRLATSARPAEGGTVVRQQEAGAAIAEGSPDSTATYGSTITLKAVPAEGYTFSGWTVDGAEASTDPTLTSVAAGDMDVVANFAPSTYRVEVGVPEGGGTLASGSAGIYSHGEQVVLVARADADHALDCWTVDGDTVATGDTLTVSVDGPMDIGIHFVRTVFRQTISLYGGWNWVSSYIDAALPADNFAYATRIVGSEGEWLPGLLADTPAAGPLQELSPGHGYKVEAAMPFTAEASGKPLDTQATPMSVVQGWNWIAWPSAESCQPQAIANADDGDFVASQTGFAEFADGSWQGTLDALEPGQAYLYKSMAEKALAFDFAKLADPIVPETGGEVDVRKYPATMNITAELSRNGAGLSPEGFTVRAMAAGECRGVSRTVGGRLYITVYGDPSVPTPISFVVTDDATGETYEATEGMVFTDDVVGSRHSPYTISIGATPDGISSALSGTPRLRVYTADGILVSGNATRQTLERLPKGVYIINGKKYVVK